MSYTIYDNTVVIAQQILATLTHILKKGEASPHAATLPAARLYPDMQDLGFQVESVTDTAVKMVYRLSGTTPVFLKGGKPTSFEAMFTRIEQAKKVLAEADKDLINSRIDEPIVLPIDEQGNKGKFHINAQVWAYSLPNMFFHLSTAYGIMRKEGVVLGKADYLESFGAYEPLELV